MDGSGLCIPIRLKNAWGRNLSQIRGARSSSQGKKSWDDQSRCASKIKSSYFLRPRFCGHIFLKTTSYASDFTLWIFMTENFFFVTHLGPLIFCLHRFYYSKPWPVWHSVKKSNFCSKIQPTNSIEIAWYIKPKIQNHRFWDIKWGKF